MLTIIKSKIAHHIHQATQSFPQLSLSVEDIEKSLELPKQIQHGHLAYPVFALSKALKQGPPQIASQLSQKLSGVAEIEKLNPMGGYLNIVLKTSYIQSILTNAMAGDASKLGYSRHGAGKT